MGKGGRATGKRFEAEITRSLLHYGYGYSCPRIVDGPGYGSIRPADHIDFGPGFALILECKSIAKASLPLVNIKPHQIDTLLLLEGLGHRAYLVVNIRHQQACRTWAIRMSKVSEGIICTGAKSIPLRFLEERGIELPQVKLGGKIGWDLSELLSREGPREAASIPLAVDTAGEVV